MSDRDNCGRCKFLRQGECHRFPPAMAPWPTGTLNDAPHITYEPSATWPTVGEHDWCGEFRINA